MLFRTVQVALFLVAFCPISFAGFTTDTILVTDQASGRLFRVSLDGSVSNVSSGGFFNNPLDVTYTNDGRLFVANAGQGSTNRGSIVEVDPITGAQTIRANSGLVKNPVGIASDAVGNLYVTDQGMDNFSDRGVYRLAANTFDQTSLSNPRNAPRGIALAPNGNVIYSDTDLKRLFAIDGVNDTEISDDPSFVSPVGLDVDAAGFIFLANQQSLNLRGDIRRVDPITGDAELISEGLIVSAAQDVALDSQGNIFVTSNAGGGTLLRIDRNSLDQTIIASGLGNTLGGIHIVGPAGTGPGISAIPEPSSVAFVSIAIFFLAQRRRRQI